MKLTKENIEKMANEVIEYCKKHNYRDVIMFYNGKKALIGYGRHEELEIQDNVDPHDYDEYYAYNHIFSMSSEGGLDLEYELFNQKGVYKIFKKYGVYAELCDSYSCTCYLIDDDTEVEYTVYERPKERVDIYNFKPQEDILLRGLQLIYADALDKAHPKVNGSCIIGDGINFELDGQPYFFDTNYQQSDVVSSVINACELYLKRIGATNIWYDCGRMD